MPIDEFPRMAAGVLPPVDATGHDRRRIAGLAALSLSFGAATPFGTALTVAGALAASWEPVVVGFWLMAACCPAATACAAAAAFISSRRGIRCPRRVVAGIALGLAGLALMAGTVVYAVASFGAV